MNSRLRALYGVGFQIEHELNDGRQARNPNPSRQGTWAAKPAVGGPTNDGR